MANAALIDGHDIDKRTTVMDLTAAMANAALIDGHGQRRQRRVAVARAAMANAALIDGHVKPPREGPFVVGRDGQRGLDRWTPRPHSPPAFSATAAMANAALIDGHHADLQRLINGGAPRWPTRP